MKYYFGENFRITDIISEDEADNILTTGSGYLDVRTGSITHGIEVDDWRWYYNYITFQQFIAARVNDAKPMYMLDLGYVPVIYLPSCVVNLSHNGSNITELMYRYLDNSDFDYVTTHPMSFVRNKVDIDTLDAWVHKMQAAEILGCKPEEVRSLDIIRSVYG